jgi:hypothetical protein
MNLLEERLPRNWPEDQTSRATDEISSRATGLISLQKRLKPPRTITTFQFIQASLSGSMAFNCHRFAKTALINQNGAASHRLQAHRAFSKRRMVNVSRLLYPLSTKSPMKM